MSEHQLSNFDSTYHAPVMWGEVVSIFESCSGVMLDGTLGGGGHSLALLTQVDTLRILGLDRDDQAIAFAGSRLQGFGTRIRIEKASFSLLEEVLQSNEVQDFFEGQNLVGALFDLGVSSHQLDDPSRGFSFRNSGPLDMRMDQQGRFDLQSYLMTVAVQDLARAIAENGERRFARLLARKLIEAARSGSLSNTADLREVVLANLPKAYLAAKKDPATKVFQALRIEVNDELTELDHLLGVIGEVFAPGSRICIISYHSGEDQRVKRAFTKLVGGGCICPTLLACVCGAQVRARFVHKLLRPTELEVQSNPRSRSARLRAIEIVSPIAVAALRGA